VRPVLVRAHETMRAVLGWRVKVLRPSPNVSLLLTNGPTDLARGAHLAAEAGVERWPSRLADCPTSPKASSTPSENEYWSVTN
jgi:hypothetical protein